MSEYSGDTNAHDNDLKPTTEQTAISAEISMIMQLIQQNRDEDKVERSQTKADIADLRSALSAFHNSSPMSSHDSPIINRGPTTRRTSMAKNYELLKVLIEGRQCLLWSKIVPIYPRPGFAG